MSKVDTRVSLVTRRKQLGSQDQAAKLIGLPVSYIERLEKLERAEGKLDTGVIALFDRVVQLSFDRVVQLSQAKDSQDLLGEQAPVLSTQVLLPLEEEFTEGSLWGDLPPEEKDPEPVLVSLKVRIGRGTHRLDLFGQGDVGLFPSGIVVNHSLKRVSHPHRAAIVQGTIEFVDGEVLLLKGDPGSVQEIQVWSEASDNRIDCPVSYLDLRGQVVEGLLFVQGRFVTLS